MKRKTAAKRVPGQARPRKSGFGIYTPAERAIYRYCGGCGKVKCQGCRAVDPLEIQQQFLEFPELDIETDSKIFFSEMIPEREKMVAFRRLIGAARKAFCVEPYRMDANGKECGLTNGEVLNLMMNFGTWIAELKKKQGVSATSPKPMEPQSSGTGSTIATGAASSSTGNGSSAAVPPLSPKESPPPSEPSCPIPSSAG